MNKLSGEIPFEIGSLSRLEVLSLYNNAMTGEIPTSLYTIKTLKILLGNPCLIGC